MKTRLGLICSALVYCLLIPSIATAGVSIIGGLSHQKKVESGDIYEGSILIKNTQTEVQEIKIFQTDFHFRFDGSNDYGTPGKSKRSNANWLKFNPHRLIIPLGEVVTVKYKVTVPENPNLIGTYWSMLMVEEIPKNSPQSTQPEIEKTKLGITQIMRYGIQMITHIGDTGERKLKFLETKLLREVEKRVLQVDVENVGQRLMVSSLWVELYDNMGGYIGRFEGGRKRLFPSTSVRFNVDLSEIPKGNYQSLIVADCGGDDIFGANYKLEFEQ